MSEEFFEGLLNRLPVPAQTMGNVGRVWGRREVIEALKEMMVGEPSTSIVRVREEPLFQWDGKEYVPLCGKDGRQKTALYGYIELLDKAIKDYPGTDGEEVTVLVVSHETKG